MNILPFQLLRSTSRGRQLPRDWLEFWPLLVPALGAFAMYALVQVEPRYVFAWITIVTLSLFASIAVPHSRLAARVPRGVATGVLVTVLLGLGPAVVTTAKQAVLAVLSRDPAVHLQWEIAQGVRRLGSRPGEAVGFIGAGYFYWARLADVRVVAEISSSETPVDVELFWSADPTEFGRTMKYFAEAGVRMVIADTVPDPRSHPQWSPLGGTGYAVYVLAPPRTSSTDDGPS